MPNYIPEQEAKYDDFVNTFGDYVAPILTIATPGGATPRAAADVPPITDLPPALVAAVTAALGNWNTAYADHKTAQTAAGSAATLKDDARAALTAAIRPVAQIIQNDPTITDAQRQAAGLPVLATTHTASPVPTTRPVAQVDTRIRLQHTLSWRDEASPKSKAKPAGVQGAEIWAFINATPPTSPSQCHFVALDTASPYLLVHDAADAGKVAHYMLRWVNTRNQPGPWSETVSATIGA
jgi:hypothetical protein